MNDEYPPKPHDDVEQAILMGFNRLYVEQIAQAIGVPAELLEESESSSKSALEQILETVKALRKRSIKG